MADAGSPAEAVDENPWTDEVEAGYVAHYMAEHKGHRHRDPKTHRFVAVDPYSGECWEPEDHSRDLSGGAD